MRRAALALAAVVVLLTGLGPLAIALREPDDGRTLPAEVPGRLIDVGGRRVHVVERGAGPPLVLIHGFGGSTHDFEELVLDPLAHTHSVIAVDLFGHGWSERSDDLHYGWTLWAEQIAGTLDALGIRQAALLGHSMGGAVGAVLAARHPERVERLILADAFYPPLPDEIRWPFRLMRTPILGELALGAVPEAGAPGFSAAHHARALQWYRIRGTRRGLLQYVRDPAKLPELTAAYPGIRAPTLVLHGKADAFATYEAMQRAVPAIANAKVVTLTGDHFPFRDDVDAFLREVEAFLVDVEG